MIEKRKYRMRKGSVLPFSFHNWKAEAGDKMVDPSGTLYYLYESNGIDKRASGELSYRIIPPPVDMPDAKAVIENGSIYWVRIISD